jgi:hypothetical protein
MVLLAPAFIDNATTPVRINSVNNNQHIQTSKPQRNSHEVPAPTTDNYWINSTDRSVIVYFNVRSIYYVQVRRQDWLLSFDSPINEGSNKRATVKQHQSM